MPFVHHKQAFGIVFVFLFHFMFLYDVFCLFFVILSRRVFLHAFEIVNYGLAVLHGTCVLYVNASGKRVYSAHAKIHIDRI